MEKRLVMQKKIHTFAVTILPSKQNDNETTSIFRRSRHGSRHWA
jgi:hypothetical protein